MMLSRTIDTWVDIEASPDRIWEVLVDFPKWGIRFRQIERFNGPMVLLMDSMIKKTEKGYHQMNNLLKKRVEELT